jgi:hypothetical protein
VCVCVCVRYKLKSDMVLHYIVFVRFIRNYYYYYYYYHHHDHHHHQQQQQQQQQQHHLAGMQLVHLLTRSGLRYPEVSSNFSPAIFCPFVALLVFSVICYEAFCLHVATCFFYSKQGLYLLPFTICPSLSCCL